MAWALYDWANSAFATTVMAGFFPVFFKTIASAGVASELSTARLGLVSSAGTLVVALLAPLLGAFADSGGFKKRFLGIAAFLGAIFTAGLAFVPAGYWQPAILLYGAAAVVFAVSLCFYDSLLPFVATPKTMNRVSALGFAWGYFGGGLLFLVNVFMFQRPDWFGLASSEAALRMSFITVGVWWGVFTLPLLFCVPEKRPVPRQPLRVYASNALASLKQTLKDLRQLRQVLLFLAAFYFFNDGVGTIMKMATDYGLSIGFGAKDLILALVIVQFIGFPATLAIGWLAERWRGKTLILICIGGYIGAVLWATQMRRPAEFYGLAVIIGCIQGGIQALSRALYARIIPADKTAEFFGFYNLMGKFSGLLGPTLVGLVGYTLGNARWGIASILLLFLIGGSILFCVKDPEERLAS